MIEDVLTVHDHIIDIDSALDGSNDLGQSVVTRKQVMHYLLINCAGRSCANCSQPACPPGRLTEDARLLSGWLGSGCVCTSVVFSQDVLLPTPSLPPHQKTHTTQSNQGSFWNALVYCEGLAEVFFHFRSLNWIQVKQALDWPNILKVFFKESG